MTFSYELATDVGKIRLLLSDTVQADAYFTDEEISTFLTLEASSVKRAAALGLETIASNEALVLKVIKTLDLETDGAEVAKALREHAQDLRDQADEGEDGWDIAELVYDDFTYRERLEKQMQRES